MKETIERLKDKFEKVICEFSGDCYLCYLKKGSKWYLVGLSEGAVPYAKVVSYDESPLIQNCEGLLAYPKGLFAFAKDYGELAEKVELKIRRLA